MTTPDGPVPMNPLPNVLLLLHNGRDDTVSAVILDAPSRFAHEVVAVSLDDLANRTTVVDGAWRVGGRTIDPAATVVVNRLAAPGDASSPLRSYFAERTLWLWLSHELARFAYATSLPTATSIAGCHGSLLDQWSDLPALVGGLAVPDHRGPWDARPLAGDLHEVDPWRLYSLGTRRARDAPRAAPLAYARPPGFLVHVAQVGPLVLFGPAPPGMTSVQQSAIVSFADALASTPTSASPRILEHAFFVGDGPPVFYSTCPFPVITGSLAQYPELLARGLADDVARRARVPA